MLKVLNSQMTSNDSRSEGILLVSTGRGVFTNSRFIVTPAQGQAILYAQSCTQRHNTGTNDRCQAQ
jgi:hypothetical protein